jgi:hypothetical protein
VPVARAPVALLHGARARARSYKEGDEEPLQRVRGRERVTGREREGGRGREGEGGRGREGGRESEGGRAREGEGGRGREIEQRVTVREEGGEREKCVCVCVCVCVIVTGSPPERERGKNPAPPSRKWRNREAGWGFLRYVYILSICLSVYLSI